MYCPLCQEVQLVMADRQGIEIDYCPQCRGVWLDRGELDKLIERSTQPYQSPQRPQQPPTPSVPVQPPGYQQPQNYNPHQDHYKKKKREGFLGDLFDFD